MNAVTQQEQAALTLPQRAAVALGAAEHEVKLRELVKSSADIVSVIDPAGREQAHRIAMTLKNARVAIEKTGKAAREDATAFSKAVIAEEKRLVDIVTGEEARVFGLRDEFDAKVEAERQAKIAAERARVDAIQAAIQRIRDLPLQVVGATAEVIGAMIGALEQKEPGADFEEFLEQAQAARTESLGKLADALAARQEADRVAAETEQARIAEAARIEAERAELARQRVENERIANEQAAERKRLADLAEAQEAAARAQREQAEANLRAEREAQEAAIKDEQDKLAAERKALDDERAAAAKAVADAAALEITKAEAIAADETRIRLRSVMSLEELAADAPIDELIPTDAEIAALGEDFGMTLPEWVERLDLFLISTRAELAALGG